MLTLPPGEGGGQVNLHAGRCVGIYEAAHAVQCAQCQQPISGAYMTLGDAKLHEQCVEAYRAATAPKCAVCGSAIRGSYFPMANGDKVLETCKAAYDQSRRP